MKSKHKTFVIAEAGVNHNGSVSRAFDLIDAAANAGADAVKFQSFNANTLATNTLPKANYQIAQTGASETQLEMLKVLELSKKDHHRIINHCKKRKIEFLSTPFDHQSLSFLVSELGLPYIKIGSGDLTNGPLLLKASNFRTPIILSTGMASLSEIEEALSILSFGYINTKNHLSNKKSFLKAYLSDKGQSALRKNVKLLHCTTEYPAPFDEVNLGCITSLKKAFNLDVGYSDHTQGLAITFAAVTCGATIIEKHLTMDRTLPGPDHTSSLEPIEFREMVSGIRNIELAIGDGVKRPTHSEQKNALVARKTIVASKSIKKGDKFSEHNITIKRAGRGLEPNQYWDILGKTAKKNFNFEEIIGL